MDTFLRQLPTCTLQQKLAPLSQRASKHWHSILQTSAIFQDVSTLDDLTGLYITSFSRKFHCFGKQFYEKKSLRAVQKPVNGRTFSHAIKTDLTSTIMLILCLVFCGKEKGFQNFKNRSTQSAENCRCKYKEDISVLFDEKCSLWTIFTVLINLIVMFIVSDIQTSTLEK